MKKTILILVICWISGQLLAQNSIGIEAGFLGTHTSVAEYLRTGRKDYLLDSVMLSPYIGSFQAAITTQIDLGKRFFLETGFHYSRKGMSEVAFTHKSTKYYVNPGQRYIGLSVMIEYLYRFKKSKFGIIGGTGIQVDFAVGKPNNGALYSGSYNYFFMPFCRFNELDLSWAVKAGVAYKLGPGDVIVKLSYLYGLSDVLEDAFIIGRSMSAGITVGYSFKLSGPDNNP